MTTSLATALPRVEDQDLLDRVIAEQGGRPGSLLTILEKLQEQHRNEYLPMETLEYVAAGTGVPQARVYSVATFYALFNLEPQDTHTVSICRGTACHTRGSRALLVRLKLQLGLSGVPEEAGRAAFAEVREAGLAKLLPSKPRIGVGMGTCGSGNGAESVFQAFASEIDARGLAVQLAPVGCFGFCAEEPLVNVWVPGRPLLILHRVQPNHVHSAEGVDLGRPRPAGVRLQH